MRQTPKTLCLLACLALAPFAAGAAGAAAEAPKTVILGFDGADAALAQRWMDEGKLPNLARLRAEGTFSPLRSTIPSQTPVSWSTFATGLNPGRHGVFDFLKRNVADYKPAVALVTETEQPFLWGERTPVVLGLGVAVLLALLLAGALKLFRVRGRWAVAVALVVGLLAGVGSGFAASEWLPKKRPVPVNPRQGDTFWELLGRDGKRVRVVRLPQNFPPEEFEHGELLSGLGTPDLSFRIGKPFFFTSELFFQPRKGSDFSVEVVELVDNRGRIETEIKGPPDWLFHSKKDGEYLHLPMVLEVAEDRSRVSIEIGGEELSLAPGEWSDWVAFPFEYNPLVKIQGIGRFRLLSIDPEVRLYLSPIQFDPTALPPVVNITAPSGFVDHLTDLFGRFKTIGWAIDTWSLDGGTIDEGVFLEDVAFTRGEEERMLYGLLGEQDWDVLVHYFEFPDRVQHMMWRLFDPQHPMYDAALAAKYGDAVPKTYQDIDRIVGEVMAKMPPGSNLFVVSDHGFQPFRWSMNYNTWLVRNGYMTLTGEDADRKNLEDLFDQTGEFFVNVDWSRTKAYQLGLGNIYVNLKGREAQGIVEPGAEYQALLAELKAGLEAYVDPATGQHPVAHVFTRDEAHGVYDPAVTPDLIPGNNPGYRVGWQDTLGGIAKTVVEPNLQYWSGDHCSVYPPLVNGILFSNRRLAVQAPYIADMMPTVLELYGVEPSPELDGKSLLPR